MNEVVVLPGFHAAKHALRFGAELTDILSTDLSRLGELADQLSPDIRDRLMAQARQVDLAELEQYGPVHPTGVVGLARRPALDRTILERRLSPLVLLEEPRQPLNVGAVIRVAAAAGAAGVATTGPLD